MKRVTSTAVHPRDDDLVVPLLANWPAFALFHGDSVRAEDLCAEVAALAKRPRVIRRVLGDELNREDSELIRSTLLSGALLLLIAPTAPRFSSDLAKAWEYFFEQPRFARSSANRFIHFGGGAPPETLGQLGLVLPLGCRLLKHIDEYKQIRIDSLKRGPEVTSVEPIECLGRPSVSISMRTLALLHSRDQPAAAHHESVVHALRGSTPLTWTDLQRILRAQANPDTLLLLEGLAAAGRLSAEQLDLAAYAISFLRNEASNRATFPGRRIAPSIHHVLWEWARFQELGYVFRGQRSSRWKQDATLLRAESDGKPPSLGTITQRLHRTQAFLEALEKCEAAVAGRVLNDDERLAIAQHYGFPTMLLDYTRSLAVAAFFATGSGSGAVNHAGDTGVIYYVHPGHPLALPEPDPRGAGLNLATGVGIHLGRLTAIEPQLPDRENRIARQQGLFVAGFDSRTLQRLSVGAIYFQQSPGEAFEDPSSNITKEYLLGGESELARLASEVTHSVPSFSPQLLAARLPEDDIFGASNLNLYANMSRGQEFLDRLAVEVERFDPGSWLLVKGILERHLDEARVQASTANFAVGEQSSDPEGPGYVLDEVEKTLEELANHFGLEADSLGRHLRTRRASHEFGGPERPRPNEGVAELGTTPNARLALAAALFVLGLEYLRTVRGEAAQMYVQHANLELLRVEQGWP